MSPCSVCQLPSLPSLPHTGLAMSFPMLLMTYTASQHCASCPGSCHPGCNFPASVQLSLPSYRQALEARNAIREPVRSPLVSGVWALLYQGGCGTVGVYFGREERKEGGFGAQLAESTRSWVLMLLGLIVGGATTMAA